MHEITSREQGLSCGIRSLEGHLARARRIVGFSVKFKHASLRCRTGCPDCTDLAPQTCDWDSTPHGSVREEAPTGAPDPLGLPVITTAWVDANLHHDFLTGRAVTGVAHAVNQTVLDFHSKKQNAVETSTYGSEFVAARTATDQIIDLRLLTLRYLGVPVCRSVMFGDNESVVTSGSIPHSQLNKRWTALSYHRVREAIAAQVVDFWHIPGAENPADMLSKHWACNKVSHVLRPILFWRGDTKDCVPLC